MDSHYKTVMLKPSDKVAVALMEIPVGAMVKVTCQDLEIDVEMKQSIEFGHKFAVAAIKQGEDITKYGEVIGGAVCDIQQGEHVHTHNLEGKRGRGDKHE